MEGLREILSPSQILDMDDSLVTAIAAEPEEAQNERLLLTEKQKVLEAGLQTCKRYVRRRATGLYPLSEHLHSKTYALLTFHAPRKPKSRAGIRF